MSRPGHNETYKFDARIAASRRAVLKTERALALETKKREKSCRCQGGCLGGGDIYTQTDFEEAREIFETARAEWLAEHKIKTPVGLIAETADV